MQQTNGIENPEIKITKSITDLKPIPGDFCNLSITKQKQKKTMTTLVVQTLQARIINE